jgi:Xaa-Pro aminopeptidase
VPLGSYLGGTLAASNVLAAEPGLYFQPNDLTVPVELRGMGIRIEDDLVVTETGSHNLTERLPREPDPIETWVAVLAGQ